MTSSISAGSSFARSIAAFNATVPSAEAGNDASAPLNEPTGVRTAATIATDLSATDIS